LLEAVMTNDQIRSLKEDIGYMKALADEGATAPLVGGSILVAAGLIFGTASIGEWANAAGLIALQGVQHAYLWGGAGILFAITLVVLIRRQRDRAGIMAPANRAFANAWMGVGLAIFSMAVALTLLSIQLQSSIPTTVFPSLVFALYGAGWAVSAAMSGQKWLWWPAFGSWVLAPILAWFVGQPSMYLFYAVGLFAFALVPGVVLMRREPSTTV
jgi:hypothetical protein